MSKSMYSLILMDEVVDAVDKQAHEKGTSRSNLINRILAQHLSMMTPELCISQIFSETVAAIGQNQILQPLPPTSGMLTVRGVLPYKYNPSIRFVVEITEAGEAGCRGVLKVASRSQSKPLLQKLNIFFELWSQIEATCLPEFFPGARLKHEIDGGRLRRPLESRSDQQEVSPAQIGAAIGQYLLQMQSALTRCFEAEFGIDIPTYNTMLEQYRAFLDGNPVCI